MRRQLRRQVGREVRDVKGSEGAVRPMKQKREEVWAGRGKLTKM